MAVAKPYLLAEFGIDWQTGDERWDRRRIGPEHAQRRLGLDDEPAPRARRCSGTGTATSTRANLYHVLTPVRQVRRHGRLGDDPLPAHRADSRSSRRRDQPETFTDLTVPATVEWGAHALEPTTPCGHDGTRAGRAGGDDASAARSAATRSELHSRLPGSSTCRSAGKVVAAAGPGLLASPAAMSGRRPGEARPRALTAGAPGKGPWKTAKHLEQWKVWVSDYDEEIAIDVPGRAGTIVALRQHSTATGSRSARLRLPALPIEPLPGRRRARPGERPRCSCSGSTTARAPGAPSTTARSRLCSRAFTLAFPATSGTWQVEWWNTSSGEVIHRDTATVENGEMAPDHPRLQLRHCGKSKVPAAGALRCCDHGTKKKHDRRTRGRS